MRVTIMNRKMTLRPMGASRSDHFLRWIVGGCVGATELVDNASGGLPLVKALGTILNIIAELARYTKLAFTEPAEHEKYIVHAVLRYAPRGQPPLCPAIEEKASILRARTYPRQLAGQEI